MKFLSVKYRITLGLVTILLSTVLLVIFSGFGPDDRQATMEGRGKLCESIAIYSSVLISQNDVSGLEQCLAAIVERDDKILSAAVRRADGQMVVQIGDHLSHWSENEDESTETQVQVPLWSGQSSWGNVELRFQPVTLRGVAGMLSSPWTLHLALIGAITFVIFSIYLQMVLRQLDPSKAIPKRVRSALDALAEGLLVTDRKGRVVLANESFARWAGQTPEKLIGRDARKFPWKLLDTAEPHDYPWTKALEERMPQANCLLQLEARDKHELTLVANASPVLGHDGEYRGVLTSFEDITELEKHKVELSSAKQAADEANQAKSEFLARMSHEIRTPMNAILGYTEVLRRGFATDEQQREKHLRTIQHSGEHLLALINDILDLSKIEAGRMELELARCSPSELVAQVVSALVIKAEEKGLTLEYETEGKLPETILTDAVRLRQAIINLVGNAIKFTEQGGVRLCARLIKQPQPRLAIDVIDTGIGMSEEALKKVFDPFAQADTTITRRFGGTGLGLSICRQLAEQMGGEVSVTSAQGKGTTFTMTIDPGPLKGVRMVDFKDASYEAASSPSVQDQELTLPPSTILVVDDGEENRQLITLFLERVGVEVRCAENGKIAVEMASRHTFDAILMDMQMPVMDGFTATQQLREGGCTTPIIALTANVMKDDERRCREAGCSGFLPKPISMTRLFETLNEALGPRPNTSKRAAEPQPKPSSSTAAPLASTPTEVNRRVSADAAGDAALKVAPVVSSLPTEDAEFREIVVGFVARLEDRLAEMREAVTQQNLQELADLAHWLKGAGGSVGFELFTEPAAALQSSAEEKDLQEATTQLAAIEAIARRIHIPESVPEQDKTPLAR